MSSVTEPTQSILSQMVRSATLAPSPDNNQPWQFRLAADRITVFLDRQHSLPSDVDSMFDLTALGAAVENAALAASDQGYHTQLTWLADPWPTGNDPLIPIADLNLTSGGDRDPLFAMIPQRCTCRKPFSSQGLEEELRRELAAACEPFPDVRVDWLTTAAQKKQFGKLIATTDGLRFRHQPFHEELFRQLRFDPREAERTSDGLDVRTLELPWIVIQTLKVLRSWSVMQAVHRLRLTALLTMPSAISVQRSGAIAILSVPQPGRRQYFDGGRAIQRFWLAATAKGLSMHPLGSIPIFLAATDPKPEFRKPIEKARQGVFELLPHIESRTIQLAFRIGYSKPPSERSRRRSSQEVMIGDPYPANGRVGD